MRILIAEDDPLLRALLEDFISELGHCVESAANGMELVKMAFAARPDLIVTDLCMPEMSGDSMIAMLDMYPDLAGIPVVVISGLPAAGRADMGLPSDIPVLGKPYNFAEIALQLERVEQRRGIKGAAK